MKGRSRQESSPAAAAAAVAPSAPPLDAAEHRRGSFRFGGGQESSPAATTAPSAPPLDAAEHRRGSFRFGSGGNRAASTSKTAPLPRTMSAPVAAAPAAPRYELLAESLPPEDVVFCVDVSAEDDGGCRRLDAVRQAVLLFVHAKRAASKEHRFAFAALGRSFSWVKSEFSNEVDSAVEALNSYSADACSSSDASDITGLLEKAAYAAKKSRLQGRLLRVILIYGRSSVLPSHNWALTEKIFTLDIIYLHDKPSLSNCPQAVYDDLNFVAQLVSKHEPYTFEVIFSTAAQRLLFNDMCILLSHPVQRCTQDEIDFPKVLQKKEQIKISKAPSKKASASSNGYYEDYAGLY